MLETASQKFVFFASFYRVLVKASSFNYFEHLSLYIRDKTLEKDVIQQLETCFAQNTTGPFGSSARFQLISATQQDSEALKGLGTYGFIKNANAFIVGAVKTAEKMNLEDFGYLMQSVILFATSLGLGTCWLGGTFKRSSSAQKIAVADDEIVAAVSRIGDITEKRSSRDRLIRWSAGSAKRKPWETLFFNETFDTPLSETQAGNYAVPLEMVRLGPSASNKQPWRIVEEKDKSVLHLFLQWSKGYDKNQDRFDTVDLQ